MLTINWEKYKKKKTMKKNTVFFSAKNMIPSKREKHEYGQINRKKIAFSGYNVTSMKSSMK